MPLISIAMTTYNGEKYLREQLDSIINQTYIDWKLIICDDCSKDTTWSILEDYSKSDTRIKIFKNEQNLGFKKNFEKAIIASLESNPEYIALSDQDDVWCKNHLELLVNKIGNNSIACANAIMIDSNGNNLNRKLNEVENLFFFPDNNKYIWRIFFFGGGMQGASMLLNRSFIEKCIPIPSGVDYHDSWFSACACVSGGISYSFEIINKYRQHGNNVTYIQHNKKKEKIIFVIKRKLSKFFSGVHTDRFCYIEELSKRFGTQNSDFCIIKELFERIRNRKIRLIDIYLIWKNYENIMTRRGHKFFIRKLIAWTKLCPNE